MGGLVPPLEGTGVEVQAGGFQGGREAVDRREGVHVRCIIIIFTGILLAGALVLGAAWLWTCHHLLGLLLYSPVRTMSFASRNALGPLVCERPADHHVMLCMLGQDISR